MCLKDQQTLSKAIIAQAVLDLRSRSGQQRAAARRFLIPSSRLLAWASFAGMRASALLVAAREARK